VGKDLSRSLCDFVEFADRLDLVTQQLDTNRMRAMGREDVENAASNGEFAPLLDERHPRVARGNQGFDERITVGDLADFEVDRTTAHDFARGHPERERRPRSHRDGRGFDPHIRLRARQPAIEDVHSLRDQKRLRGEALVGVRVVARICAHAPALDGFSECGAEVLDQRVAGLGVRGDEERGRITELGNESRSDDGPRAAAQAREMHRTAALGAAPSDVV
jgi:hypothetical protein